MALRMVQHRALLVLQDQGRQAQQQQLLLLLPRPVARLQRPSLQVLGLPASRSCGSLLSRRNGRPTQPTEAWRRQAAARRQRLTQQQ
jgi:hypothetical protein